MSTFNPNYPAWMCESHIREVQDWIDCGLDSEAREIWAERKEWRQWCNDCKNVEVA